MSTMQPPEFNNPLAQSSLKHPSNKPSDQRKHATFFSLSAELRNRIYEEALIHPNPILITTTLNTKPPGLLSVNRQIRHEATSIYYLDNTFEIAITSLDASLLGAFHCHTSKYGDVSIRAEYRQRPRWENLMIWARQIWEGRSRGVEPTRELLWTTADVVKAMAGIAVEGRALEWERVERAVMGLRPLAVRFNEDWGMDGEEWERAEYEDDMAIDPFD